MIKILLIIIVCLIFAFAALYIPTKISNQVADYVCELLLFLIVVFIAFKYPNQ